jgi:hypothetical protein
VIAAIVGFAVYGVRTGAVLQRKLPRFPPLTWQALHILMGLGVGIVVAALELQADSAPRENLTPSSMLSMAVGGMMIGAFMGAGAGVLQALVLRKAAREVGDWIRWSALAGTTLGGYALALGIGFDQPLREVLVQLLSFAIAIASGIVMLPALLRLRPH